MTTRRASQLSAAERKLLGRLSETAAQLLVGPDERLARGLRKRELVSLVGGRVVGGGHTYVRTHKGSMALLKDTLRRAEG